MPSVRSADSAARLPVRREQRDKWKECEAAGALVEEQLEAMTKERDEAEQDDSVQLAALRAELAAKSEELAAAVAATAEEDEAAEAAVQAGQAAFAFANATVSQLEVDLREAQDQNGKSRSDEPTATATRTPTRERERKRERGREREIGCVDSPAANRSMHLLQAHG